MYLNVVTQPRIFFTQTKSCGARTLSGCMRSTRKSWSSPSKLRAHIGGHFHWLTSKICRISQNSIPFVNLGQDKEHVQFRNKSFVGQLVLWPFVSSHQVIKAGPRHVCLDSTDWNLPLLLHNNFLRENNWPEKLYVCSADPSKSAVRTDGCSAVHYDWTCSSRSHLLHHICVHE